MEGAKLFLFNWAGAFVLLAWGLFLVVVVVGCTIGINIGIYNAYGSGGQRDVWPIHATIMSLLLVATVLAFGVALFASITPHRALASIAVISVWVTLVIGSAISLALTPAGPQELFTRSVGDEKFSMPNRYRPPNEQSGGGFAFLVCLDPFDEPDQQLCQVSAYVSVKTLEEGLAYYSGAKSRQKNPSSSNRGFVYVSDIETWQNNRHKMKSLDPLFGHEQFEFTWPMDYDPNSTATNFYFARFDGDRLARLVRCYGKSSDSKCTQYVFSEDRLLMIDSRMWAFEHWIEVEKNIESLLTRWRTNQSPE